MSDVTLTANGSSVTLHGDGDWQGPGIALTGIAGWYQTPDPKITVTARGQGDGGHDIAESDILYAARVVTVGYRVIAGDRQEALGLLAQLDRAVHGLVACRVTDQGQDTQCVGGYYSRSLEQKIQNPLWQNLSGDITLVFERPERVTAEARRIQLTAQHVSMAGGGLDYSTNHTGLRYPLSYGLKAEGAGTNVGVLTNQGSSRAYPVFIVNGPMPDGVRLDFPGLQQSIHCTQPVQDVPLVLDSRTRTASIGGQDVSRTLEERGFPTVPPDRSINVVLSSLGGGFVDCAVRDTYM